MRSRARWAPPRLWAIRPTAPRQLRAATAAGGRQRSSSMAHDIRAVTWHRSRLNSPPDEGLRLLLPQRGWGLRGQSSHIGKLKAARCNCQLRERYGAFSREDIPFKKSTCAAEQSGGGATHTLIRIIYCATTAAVDQLAGALKRAGIPVVRYHGKMRAADRAAAQRRFMQPSRHLIMVATRAFGMGIDKPNIRYILHYQTPGSLEQYVQEIGRAGRDGRPGQCILLFDPADLEIHEHLQAQGRPSVRHLERLEAALTAWKDEERAPNADTRAYS